MIGYFNTYLQKYGRSKKQKTYSSIGFSLILILIFLVFALRPTLLTVTNLREKLSQGREASQQLDQKIESLNQARINFEKVKPKIVLLDEALPKSPLILDFMNKVNWLAKTNNLVITKLQSSGVPFSSAKNTNSGANVTIPVKKFKAIQFSLKAKGQYPNIRAFTDSLGNLRRINNFKEIKIEKNKDKDELNLSLSGEIYFLPR